MPTVPNVNIWCTLYIELMSTLHVTSMIEQQDFVYIVLMLTMPEKLMANNNVCVMVYTVFMPTVHIVRERAVS